MALSRAIVVIVVITLLGPAQQGMLSVSMAVSVVASMLVGAGVEVANGYLTARRLDAVRPIIGNSVALAMCGGGILGLGIWLTFPSLPFFGGFDPGYRLPLALSVAPATAFVLLSGIGVGLNRYPLLLAANMVVNGTYLAAGIGFAMAGSSASAILAGWVVASVLGSGVLVLRLPTGHGPSFGLGLLREQITYGSRAYATNLLSWLNFRVDLLMVSALLGPLAAGFYSFAATVAEGLLYVGKAAAQPLMTHALGGDHSWSAAVERAYRMVLGGTLLLGVLVVVGATVLGVLGGSLAPAIPALIILAVAQAPMALAIMAAAHLFGLGVPGRTIPAGLAAFGTTVGLNLLAIPMLGIAGAAVVSLVAYTLAAGLQLRQLRRTLRTEASWLSLVPRPSDLTMLRSLGALIRREPS